MSFSSSDATTRRQRLILIALVGGALLHEPLLGLFNHPVRVAGIPLMHGALFGIWALLIVAVVLHAHRAPADPTSHVSSHGSSSTAG